MYIGVRDDGEVIGLSNSKKLMEDIPNAIVSAFGMYDAEVNLKRDEERKYIEIIIPKSNVVLDYKGVPYIKIGTTLQIMKGEAFRQSVLSRGSLSWDAYPVDGVSIDDLYEESFDVFREEAVKTNALSGVNLEDRLSILNELELMSDGKLTRAAVLLFHSKPYKIFPGAYIQIGRFASDADILYQDEIKGSLMTLGKSIFRALDTNYKYNLISYDKTTRNETPPYPDIVIREAIYNSLMHCDWSSCQPITIKVFDLKMEISNRSVLPQDWTIKHHNSMHINPLISNAFKNAGFVEKFGTGIPKMIDACRKYGNPEPDFTVYDKSISLILKPSEKYLALVKKLYGEDVGENVGENASFYMPCRISKNAKERRARIVSMIREKPEITAGEIAIMLEVSARTIERDLNWLKEGCIIKRQGGAKSGIWIVEKEMF